MQLAPPTFNCSLLNTSSTLCFLPGLHIFRQTCSTLHEALLLRQGARKGLREAYWLSRDEFRMLNKQFSIVFTMVRVFQIVWPHWCCCASLEQPQNHATFFSSSDYPNIDYHVTSSAKCALSFQHHLMYSSFIQSFSGQCERYSALHICWLATEERFDCFIKSVFVSLERSLSECDGLYRLAWNVSHLVLSFLE